MTVWQRCWQELRLARRRWSAWPGAERVPGSLKSAVSVLSVSEAGLIGRAYPLSTENAGLPGVRLLVHLAGEELLRIDCLGPGGHYHVNIDQSIHAAHGAVPRVAFLVDEIYAQIEQVPLLLERNLRNAIACNWNPAVRGAGASLDAAQIARFGERAKALMLELTADRTAVPQDATEAP